MSERAVLEFDGIEVVLSHPDRVLFPDDGITKRHLVEYYVAVAPFLLPHLRDRPVTVQRFPRGILVPGFWQRHLPAGAPPWLARTEVPLADRRRSEHAAIEKVADLVFWVGQDAIAFHPWPVRSDAPLSPDLLVIDLDPPEGVDLHEGFDRARRVARAAVDLLCGRGCPCFVRTTGSRGLHIVVPLRRGPGFAEVRAFARGLAERVVEQRPDLATLEPRREERGGRVYLDLQRNAPAQSAVAAYSARALPRAPVATPLFPDELDREGLGPRDFTIADIPARLAARGDPWEGMYARAVTLAELERRLCGGA